MNDTSPEMQKLYHDLLMKKTGEERLLMGMRMCDMAERMVLSSFPDGISDHEKRVRLLYRYYSHDFSNNEEKNCKMSFLVMRLSYRYLSFL